MPLFFFVSGFLTPPAWERRRRVYAVQVETGSTINYARADPAKEYLRDRFKRLFLPFVFLFLALAPLRELVGVFAARLITRLLALVAEWLSEQQFYTRHGGILHFDRKAEGEQCSSIVCVQRES